MRKMQIEMFGDAYPSCSSVIHYTKEILNNTKEYVKSQTYHRHISGIYRGNIWDISGISQEYLRAISGKS